MKNIVILGAGFGGLRIALKLNKLLQNRPDYKIILIDKNSYQTYTPSLYEIAAAYKGKGYGLNADASEKEFEEELAGSSCFVLRDILSAKGRLSFGGKNTDVEFMKDEVIDINLSSRVVITKSQDMINYKYLVVAMGAETSFYNLEGAPTCCYTFKTLSDALRIRSQIEDAVKRSVGAKQGINIVVIGGGFSGFEVVAEIAKYTRHLLKNSPGFDMSRLNIKLLEAGDNILKEAPVSMQRLAEKRLKKLGIKVLTGLRVKKVEPHQVTCENGKVLPADVSIWTGGVQGHNLFKKVDGLRLHAENSRILVDNYLRIEGTQNSFAIGDSSYFEKDGNPVPATAWAANQQADSVSQNIWRGINNRTVLEYKPRFPGFVSAAGGKYGIAHLFGVTIAGFPAWVIKRSIDLKYILSIYPFWQGLGIWFKELRLWTKND